MSRKVEQSRKLQQRAERVIPGGVNSPVRAFRAVGGDPPFIVRGHGSRLWDADGNEYIDYIGSWGPQILGHAAPVVIEALGIATRNGTSFGASTPSEAELAEVVISAFPGMQKVRFVSSGTEATMSAIRLARAYTKRKYIIKFEGCYHGHADALLVKAGSGVATLGIPGSAGVQEVPPPDRMRHNRAGGWKHGLRATGTWLPGSATRGYVEQRKPLDLRRSHDWLSVGIRRSTRVVFHPPRPHDVGQDHWRRFARWGVWGPVGDYGFGRSAGTHVSGGNTLWKSA